ncbi:MAG: Crp/Fnr family transcriptional regulator [Labedaea sp.]
MPDDREPVVGSLLAYLDPADRDVLLGLGARRSFPGGELLLRQGDPTDHVLVLEQGWVRVFSATTNGHEVLVALRGPGDVIGDQAALHGWLRTASISTLEPVNAVLIRGEQLLACLRTRPTIALAMIRQMSERLREAESARIDFAALDVTKRVATFLLRLAAQHATTEPDGIVLRMPLTQQDIANRVGASRRAVARSLAVLRERQIVSTLRRRIVIRAPDVLELFSGAE